MSKRQAHPSDVGTSSGNDGDSERNTHDCAVNTTTVSRNHGLSNERAEALASGNGSFKEAKEKKFGILNTCYKGVTSWTHNWYNVTYPQKLIVH